MGNNLLSAWSTVGSVALSILLLLVMITIHELGHYLAGKLLKFKIDEFAIGFGPALFKHKSKKTGELFSVRLIPLGGYCAFAGEDGLEDEKEASPIEKKDGEEPFAELSPPNGDAQETAVPQNAEEIKPAVIAEDGAEPTSEPPKQIEADGKAGYFTHKKPWQRIIVLVAGAFMNYVLAVILLIICFFAYGQSMIAVYKSEGYPDESYHEENSLQDLDILLKADGKNIYLSTDIARAVNNKKAGDRVEFYISRAVGVVWNTEENGDEKPTYDYRVEKTVEIVLRADVKVKNSADMDAVWKALGVQYKPALNAEGEDTGGIYMTAGAAYRFGFFETLGRAFAYSFKIAGSIFKVIGELLTGHLGISALGGPVTTIAMTSKIARSSFRGFLEIAGFIGVNLAVFNLLPIPALDGSKIVFTVIEWIRKKPISRKVEAIIHAVGFLLLLGFAVLVDILQFVL